MNKGGQKGGQMARPIHKLTAAEVKALPTGTKRNDGGGLWVHKRKDGSSQWFLRYTLHGRRREMGLGSTVNVELKKARELARHWKQIALQGEDPIKVRNKERRLASLLAPNLRSIVYDTFEAQKNGLKDGGKAGRWLSPLELHVLPKLGTIPVTEIDQNDVRDALTQIWHTKSATAKKALNRLGICMRHAAAMGLEVDLQATTNASALLGTQLHKPKHIPAMPWRDAPEFYASLSKGSVTELALRFLMLTAVRSRPLRFMRYDQVNGSEWVIPAELMKGQVGATQDFAVPLSTAALSTLELVRPFERDGYVFPSARRGVLSDATMARYMERANLVFRPHGFRSSIRDWLAETTNVPHEVAETILGHRVGSQVERAYRRTDFFEQRMKIMEEWGSFLMGSGSNLPSEIYYG